jgi:hypothetical protein
MRKILVIAAALVTPLALGACDFHQVRQYVGSQTAPEVITMCGNQQTEIVEKGGQWATVYVSSGQGAADWAPGVPDPSVFSACTALTP